VFKDTRRVGDGRRKEKKVSGAGGGSEYSLTFYTECVLSV